ncbi:MAG: tRNA (adenosine(37)-N6)-dimethylallyltransferase MiaA, partial [Lachnospiraceae bacterium]|nr:tRNA (adenosine(37)-N6)-dimethylallyltransferase MiaA [Lachnospiraceae bacterium]
MEEAARRDGPQALHRRLQEIDPEAAEAIHPNNVKRIIRALEFAQNSGGLKISEHNRRERMREPAFNAVFFVLTMDRKKLYERIDARVDLMMQKGLADEVRRLRAGGLTASDVSMQGIGYRQIFPALEGEYSLDEAVRLIKRDSRHFAKRQLTWFRREKNVIWIDADSFADRQKMSDTMEEMIRTRLHLPQEKV